MNQRPSYAQPQALYGQHQQPSYQTYSDDNSRRPSFTSGLSPALPSAPGMRSYHGATGASSQAGSYDGRDTASSLRSSAHNLAMGSNPNYNLVQADAALEGLTERWQAYQAWWEKQYKEQPFYRIWTRSKWILLFSAVLLLAYSCTIFAVCLGYMLEHFQHAVIVMEFHSNLVYIGLGGSIVGIICALVGLIGIFRDNRLKCCGYQDPTWYGEYDLRCFPMINLPGCEHKYNLYEDKLLNICWTASFALVPVQLFVMIAALLCSNHVDAMLRSGRPGLKSFKEQ
ncbi:hypothetical protein BGZ54_007218 [Gamsiella multidivaricata]|nr:hypothetical protein BGZ54_007218 [Gamsiella multidivaricata]